MQPQLTPEEILLLIEKMKVDLENARLYLQRLQQDRAKIKYTLDYNEDNLRYLRVHCGVIGIEYVKKISDQIKRLRIFLTHAEEEIKKFEKTIENQIKSIQDRHQELVDIKEKMANKVIPFKRKNK